MLSEQRVSLFGNSRDQTLRIPWEFELSAEEAIIRREGDMLVVEPVRAGGLIALLATLEDIDTTFPDINETLLLPDNVEFLS